MDLCLYLTDDKDQRDKIAADLEAQGCPSHLLEFPCDETLESCILAYVRGFRAGLLGEAYPGGEGTFFAVATHLGKGVAYE
jgi:hypothetical protein